MNKKSQKIVIQAVVFIIILLLEFFLYKYNFIILHDMGDIPKLLLIIGCIIIVIASNFDSTIVSVTTILGYSFGFFIGVYGNSYQLDPGGALSNSTGWRIWCAVFLTFLALGLLIEIVLHKSKKILPLLTLVVILIFDVILWYDLIFPAPVKIFSRLDSRDITKIHRSGTTGGKDGDFQNDLTPEQIEQLIDLLKEVQLGKQIPRTQALSAGAVTYYTIEQNNGLQFTISPGKYFLFKETYFQFVNFDDLWDEFVDLNTN